MGNEIVDAIDVDPTSVGFEFTPADTAWHEVIVNFPGGGGNEFAQPGWGVAVSWSLVEGAAKAIAFGPVDAAADTPFDLCLDDIDFTSVPSTRTSADGSQTTLRPCRVPLARKARGRGSG